ncbi:MAG: hypothetical protein JW866_00040 [Ignavibacteriales bacterium]|nr:hypothetical protein [Ignavibacteriales bacterium]
MKIIQSFAQFEEGSPYFQHREHKNFHYLQFYSFLLSYITLKKKYGNVTMYCNQDAYNSLIKYIPYDEIIIFENRNPIRFWTVYKLDVLKSINDDFIHVDPDVFIWEDVFRPFMIGDYDVMVQDILQAEKNDLKEFVDANINFFIDSKILTKSYDGRSASCGVLGMKQSMQSYYFAGVDVMYKAINDVGVDNVPFPGIILEELMAYLIAVENDFKMFEILPHNLIIEHGWDVTGDMIGYSHMWMRHKYRKEIIQQIKRRILFEFSDYERFVLSYETDMRSNLKMPDFPNNIGI